MCGNTMPPEPDLIVIAGPTASGKSALALAIGGHLNGEIISCDSVAVYRGMDIGSAKPTPAERARIPNHLIDVVTPDVEYSAGDYGRAARQAVQQITARGRTPIVAGGTGLYLRALLDGLSQIPARDEPLRKRLRNAADRRGEAYLHRLLRRLDPSAAARIHANDAPKLIRAIELNLLERTSTEAVWQAARPEPLTGFRILHFGLAPPRDELYRRIDDRCAHMFKEGLIEETRTLQKQYGPNCRALNALGYAQAKAVLAGQMSQAEALAAAQQGHRNYAKRQGTWFRKDTRTQWLPGFGEDAIQALLASLTPPAEPSDYPPA